MTVTKLSFVLDVLSFSTVLPLIVSGAQKFRKQFDGIAFANHPLREDSVVNAGHAFMRLRDQA